MHPHQKIASLRQVSFSKYISDDDLWKLLTSCQNISLHPGEILFDEGTFKESMFIVLEGKLEVFKQNKHIAFEEMGDFFGEMSLLESKSRSASVRAVTDSVVLEINKEIFFSEIGSNPKIVWDMLITLSKRNRADLDVIDTGYGDLKRSEEKYRKIVESISDLILQTDSEGVINFANESVHSLGYEPAELIGKPFIEIMDDEMKMEDRQQVLTRRVGHRATTDLEITLKINPQSSLHGVVWNLSYLVNTSGMWSVPQHMVLKKDIEKEFLGTLLVARTEKMDLML